MQITTLIQYLLMLRFGKIDYEEYFLQETNMEHN